ncbi:hypothetical protein O9G_005263 [Rozella allomycis CSF55]|uniref:Uncharacterized protein n=1 Tax=Rozella allomycis (strain CSF55) TaxID=988480 RepID=A0A075AUT7_ROZAC|nr:hypothetical protein O9G_005263 [Rozella allomycis CSF55]|eukprot:EPZ34018.1 hypothetical protein O9G_005263 [Rozella allomycis CSF55]
MNINKLKEKNLEQTKLIERIIETLQNNPEKVETVHGFERSEPKYEEYSYFDKIQMPVGVKALYDSCHGLPITRRGKI